MEREISTGAMLGVMLLTLAAVISIGFGIFEIAQGIASKGVSSVQTSLNTVSNVNFDPYNQQVVTGTQVLDAFKTFSGEPVALLVDTLAVANGQDIANSTEDGAGTSGTDVYYVALNGVNYIDYNAVLSSSPSDTTPSFVSVGASTSISIPTTSSVLDLSQQNGYWQVTDGFYSPGGVVSYDNDLGGLYQTGNAEYIDPNSKFTATLLKSTSGNFVGIAFLQNQPAA